jgi:DNA repair protein RAD5
MQLKHGDIVQFRRTKPKPSKTNNKVAAKDNKLVKFTNPRGFDVGRLTEKHGDWVGKLLDLGIVKIKGTVVSCPIPLRLSACLLLPIYYVHIAYFLVGSRW